MVAVIEIDKKDYIHITAFVDWRNSNSREGFFCHVTRVDLSVQDADSELKAVASCTAKNTPVSPSRGDIAATYFCAQPRFVYTRQCLYFARYNTFIRNRTVLKTR